MDIHVIIRCCCYELFDSVMDEVSPCCTMCNILVNRYTIHHFKIKNKQEKFVSEAYLEFGSYVQLLHC